MALRDDVRWLEDIADGLLNGWLPSLPKVWTTKSGENLASLVMELYNKWYKEWQSNYLLSSISSKAQADLDGVRETNRILTDQIEKYEALLKTNVK